jgi:hypothetical protein
VRRVGKQILPVAALTRDSPLDSVSARKPAPEEVILV